MLSLSLLFYLFMWKSAAISIPPLPGLKEVQSGFDAVKMLSTYEENIASKLFDLGDLSTGNNYIYNVLGSNHIYSTPATVQVTNINSRVENYCHTVAYTFKDFCSR